MQSCHAPLRGQNRLRSMRLHILHLLGTGLLGSGHWHQQASVCGMVHQWLVHKLVGISHVINGAHTDL